MPTNNEFVAALPITGNANQSLLRGALVGRMIYALSAAEDSRDLVVIDPSTGDVIPALFQNGQIYEYDSADTTTAHDGVVCLVSYEGKRYKLQDLATPFSVLDKDLTTPVASPSPSVGDTYLIYSTPSGAWAGKLGYIAIYTAQGWLFCLPPIGFRVYVEDEDAFYYRDVNGDWIAGLGSVSVGAASVPLSALMWDWRVENQTTDNPPSSWTKGTAYIIRTPTVSPSNHWTGNSLKLAIAESDGVLADGDTMTIYTPWVGLTVFDKSLGYQVRWNGTAWVSAAGALVGYAYIKTDGTGSNSYLGASGTYNYISGTAPTTTVRHNKDTATLTYAAKSAANRLRFSYRVAVPALKLSFGLFRDSETSALDWLPVDNSAGSDLTAFQLVFEIAAADASSHTYYIAVFEGSATSAPIDRRLFEVEEIVVG